MNTGILIDLLQFHTDGATGTWEVADPRTKKSARAIFFHGGQITHAMSVYEGETLADVLVAQGVISRERLAEVLAGTRKMREEVTVTDLGHAVEGVASKIVQGVLMDELSAEMQPAFKPGDVPNSVVPVNSRNALLDGLLSVSRGNYTVSLLGYPNQVAVLHPEYLTGFSIPGELHWVLDYILPEDAVPAGGRRATLGEIIRRSGHERGKVGSLIYFLREIGAVSCHQPEVTRTLREAALLPEPTPALAAGAPLPPVPLVPTVQAGPVAPLEVESVLEEENPLPLPETEEEEFLDLEPVPEPVGYDYRQPDSAFVVIGEILEPVQAPAPALLGEPVLIKLPPKNPTAEEIANQWEIPNDTQETATLRRPMPVLERKMVDPRLLLERFDPNFQPFHHQVTVTHEVKLPKKAMTMLVAGVLGALALGVGGVALVWVRTSRPTLLRPGTIKVDPKKGPVGFDPASRVQAIQGLEISTALAQGEAYVAKLQGQGKNPYALRLGIVFTAQDVVKRLTTVVPDWNQQDVFLIKVSLDGDKEAYQVFAGTYPTEAEAQEAIKKLEKVAAAADITITAFRINEIKRGA